MKIVECIIHNLKFAQVNLSINLNGKNSFIGDPYLDIKIQSLNILDYISSGHCLIIISKIIS